MNCDLCNAPLSSSEIVFIPLREMQQAVQRGFNPFKTKGIDLSAQTGLAGAFGLSTDLMFQNWRQRLMADTTDWGLCPACLKAYREATGKAR
jgi:hypothetical protein